MDRIMSSCLDATITGAVDHKKVKITSHKSILSAAGLSANW